MSAPLLQVQGLTVSFAGREVVHGLAFQIQPGEKLALVGESGSGKTVTALSLLGLAQGASVRGQALFAQAQGPVDLLQLPPRQLQAIRGQDVAMIFQEPMTALNPVFTIGEQIAEVLQLKRGLSPAESAQAAIELIANTGIAEPQRRAKAYPHQLSGGQQQRIALARALANRPKVLLLDESLSALDMKLRKEMQIELKRLQGETGITFIFVTHDQEEALTMSDRIAVLSKGRVLQVGTPSEIYETPVNRTVADFIGETNFLDGDTYSGGVRLSDGQLLATATSQSGSVTLAIRPERVSLAADGELAGTVENIVYIGTDTLYLLKVAGQSGFRVRQQNHDGALQRCAVGDAVRIKVPASAIRVLPQ